MEEIHQAKTSIDVEAYSFTSTKIARAFGQAQERGVDVRAVLDWKATGEHYSIASYRSDHDVIVWLDGEHAIAHNKVILIDDNIITSSFNFTQQAENSNAENLLIITGKPKLAEAYERKFELHRAHSMRYEGVKSE